MVRLTVTVVYAAPGIEAIEPLAVPEGTTVAQAVAASGLVSRLGLPPSIAYAIHGQRAPPDVLVADGDRIELTRPLVADAKAVRRARAAAHPLPPSPRPKRRGRTGSD